jgi:translation elongation factor EF-Ts
VTGNNRTIKETIALAVGQLRENIVIKKAQVVISNPAVAIQGYAHPQCKNFQVLNFKY